MGTQLAHPTRNARRASKAEREEAVADLDWVYGKKAERPNGGAYRADQNPDGTWNIREVPGFASHKLREDEGGHDLGADWQRKAVKHHGDMWADGFLNPLIINHHDDFGFSDVYAGGHFLPVKVAKARLYDKKKGETVEVDTTFFDLMFVPEHVYAQFRRGALPYLSPEFRYADYEHVHLSALDTESPWFKFPLITIGEETPYIDDESEEPEMEGPSLTAVRHARNHALAIRSAHRNDKGAIVIDTATRDALKGELAKVTESIDSLSKRMEGEGDQGKDDAGDVPGDVNNDGQVTLADVLDQLKSLQKIISGMLGGDEQPAQQPQQQPAMPGQPVEQAPPAQRSEDDARKPGDDAAKPAEGDEETSKRSSGEPGAITKPETTMPEGKGNEDLVKRLNAAEAEVTTLKRKQAEYDAKETRATCIRKAVDELEPLQIPNLREELEKRYDDKDAGGEVGLKAYVDALKRHARPAPPKDWSGELDPMADDPPEVQAYLEHGPDVVRRAREHAKNYRQIKAAGISRRSLAEYLSANMPGVKPRKDAATK